MMNPRQLRAVWVKTRETFQNLSTTSRHGDGQPPIEIAAQKTDESGERRNFLATSLQLNLNFKRVLKMENVVIRRSVNR